MTPKDAPENLELKQHGKEEHSNFLAALLPGGIEHQEREGQGVFVKAQALPKNCPRADLERMGFVFGEDVDELFVSVTFPAGWKKEASDHPMWSYLVDDKGRKRGGIFFKAAYYDRKAHMNLGNFHKLDTVYPETADEPYVYRVVDTDGVVLFTSDPAGPGDWAKQDAERARCKAWLDYSRPDWEKPEAYW